MQSPPTLASGALALYQSACATRVLEWQWSTKD
jgi:hypothetical protein